MRIRESNVEEKENGNWGGVRSEGENDVYGIWRNCTNKGYQK